MAIHLTKESMLDASARLTPFDLSQHTRRTLALKACEDVSLSLAIQQESNARINPPPDDITRPASPDIRLMRGMLRAVGLNR
jgi:hypothetical protein